ncbi:zinc-binding alcohol dehydrogenase family protein [Dyadobacter sp. LJ53]|uniref:quinone oxidoreductase family protein n=1 Tax=Dyadobacter chenwenxiniae TaxID=2906456 RepID=UPI001F481BCF|nr:zinc-binding alcohol dehydrogenase family protein [Dyadobacter chenwenxiniae]MCF0051796.1 zinc-binding alcohol dehydrogenase family protein [Dyadobacter chenwenxiniae]
MKAAIIYPGIGLPKYTEIPEPLAEKDNQVLVSVKAVAIKQLDKSIASGRHYSSVGTPETGHVPGGDGVCLLPDGTRVYGMGISGMMAEKAFIHKDRIVKLPSALDDATAAALPNAVVGAAMGLKFKANIKDGDVVLINGATGVTGQVAVQLAKYYGAKKVIATGRNQQSLARLRPLGADETIAITGKDEHFVEQLQELHRVTPINIVIDYLWGRTAELILSVLKGKELFTNPVTYVSVGSMAGDMIQLSSAILRSVDLKLTGSGIGSWPREHTSSIFSDILPEALQLAADGKLKLDTVTGKLADIAELWTLDAPDGKRVVVML